MVLSARPRLLFFVVSKFFVCCFENFGCSIFPFNCSLTNLTTDSHSINRVTLCLVLLFSLPQVAGCFLSNCCCLHPCHRLYILGARETGEVVTDTQSEVLQLTAPSGPWDRCS